MPLHATPNASATLTETELSEIGLGRNHIVEWKNVKGRETVDARQLLIDHPDIVEKYRKVGNPTRRFSIKEVK